MFEVAEVKSFLLEKLYGTTRGGDKNVWFCSLQSLHVLGDGRTTRGGMYLYAREVLLQPLKLFVDLSDQFTSVNQDQC